MYLIKIQQDATNIKEVTQEYKPFKPSPNEILKGKSKYWENPYLKDIENNYYLEKD